MTPAARYAIQMARDYVARTLKILESDMEAGDLTMSVQMLKSGDKQLELALDQPVTLERSSSPWTALGIGIGIGLGFLAERFLRH